MAESLEKLEKLRKDNFELKATNWFGTVFYISHIHLILAQGGCIDPFSDECKRQQYL